MEGVVADLAGCPHVEYGIPRRLEGTPMQVAMVSAGIANGGTDNGKPGERSYHPGYYAAFLLDPDGNNIEAVYHGPANRSARSVVVDF